MRRVYLVFVFFISFLISFVFLFPYDKLILFLYNKYNINNFLVCSDIYKEGLLVRFKRCSLKQLDSVLFDAVFKINPLILLERKALIVLSSDFFNSDVLFNKDSLLVNATVDLAGMKFSDALKAVPEETLRLSGVYSLSGKSGNFEILGKDISGNVILNKWLANFDFRFKKVMFKGKLYINTKDIFESKVVLDKPYRLKTKLSKFLNRL